MLRLYKVEGGELKAAEGSNFRDALWIDVIAPSTEEVERLHEEFGLDLQDVADSLDPNERARVEIDESYDLLVLRSVLAEQKNGKRNVSRVETMPIGIFVVKNKIITVRIGTSFNHDELTVDFKRKPKTESKEDLFLLLIRKVNRDIERRVRPMERTIGHIQEKILEDEADEVADDAFTLSNGLIVLNTTLLSNLNAMSMLSRGKQLHLTKEKLDVAEDLENDIAQLYEMTTIYREIMSNVLDAYESTLANSLQVVMKTLTTISLILILPLMITALFSMNVILPFGDDDPLAFWIIAALSAAAVAALWAFFRLKKIL